MGWICYVCWFYFSLLVVYCGLKAFVGLIGGCLVGFGGVYGWLWFCLAVCLFVGLLYMGG